MARTPCQAEEEFLDAQNEWNLEKLELALEHKKGDKLTPTAKKYLRGLLLGYTPEDIATKCQVTKGSVEVAIAREVSPYLKKILNLADNQKINLSRVPHLLVKEGYKLEQRTSHSKPPSQPQEAENGKTVSKNTDFVGREEAEDDLDALVKRVRLQVSNKIHEQCEKLCLFDGLDTPWSVELKDICIADVKVKKESARFGSNQAPVHWQEAITTPRLIILGQLGAGKTTLLQQIASQCNQGEFLPDLVPIFINLKYFSNDAQNSGINSLIEYIIKTYFPRYSSEQEPKILLDQLLKSGRVLILLDGLEETTQNNTNKLLNHITDLEEDSKNQVIISCRKASQAYQSNQFKGFTFVELATFEQKQIEEFVTKWFEAIPGVSPLYGTEKAANFIELLRENKQIQELAGIPLLLHLTCLVFQETDDFPLKRAALYSTALNLLLAKWNKFNGGVELDEAQCKSLLERLSQIATIAFEQDELDFKLDEIERLGIASEDILKSIEAQHGILVKTGIESYSFSHKTFQEYLTARKFAFSNETQDLEKLINYINNPNWREVFLLTAEMLNNADNLLESMKRSIDQQIAKNIILQEFLNSVYEKSSNSFVKNKGKDAVVRAFYIAGVLPTELTLDRAYTEAKSLNLVFDSEYGSSTLLSQIIPIFNNCFANDLSFALKRAEESASSPSSALDILNIFNRDLANELRQLLQPLAQICINNEDNIEEWWKIDGQDWTNQLKTVMNQYDQIGCNWQLTRKHKGFLKEYYKANQLLVDCLNSTSDVSPEVRSRIEDELFLPIFEIQKRRQSN